VQRGIDWVDSTLGKDNTKEGGCVNNDVLWFCVMWIVECGRDEKNISYLLVC